MLRKKNFFLVLLKKRLVQSFVLPLFLFLNKIKRSYKYIYSQIILVKNEDLSKSIDGLEGEV